MWLQPPPSEGGGRWIATGLLRRRPHARFYCEVLRTSRTWFAQLKSRHQGIATDTNVTFLYFPPCERDSGLADYSSTPASVNLGRYVTQSKRCSADPRGQAE